METVSVYNRHEWELDFYSRPIVDEQQKKLWELLICDSQRTFEYVKTCTGSQANARWLTEALADALQQWRQISHRSTADSPEKIRFFRRPMQNMITRACQAVEVPSQLSRRTFALYQWLKQRSQEVYPQHPGFQPPIVLPLELGKKAPQRLPDALVGNTWRFATLSAAAFTEIDQWRIDFGDSLPLTLQQLAPETPVPGILIFSPRAVPLAAWMSGLELAFLTVEPEPQTGNFQLLLETGDSDRWIMASLKEPQILAAAQSFEQTKQQAQQIHFLAVQTDPESEAFAGFWLLQEFDIA